MSNSVNLRKSPTQASTSMVVIDVDFLLDAARDAFRQFFVPITAAFTRNAVEKARPLRDQP